MAHAANVVFLTNALKKLTKNYLIDIIVHKKFPIGNKSEVLLNLIKSYATLKNSNTNPNDFHGSHENLSRNCGNPP